MTISPTVAPPVPDRLLTRGFLLLAAGELAYFAADGMAVYLVPVHATGPLGAGGAGAGLAFGAFALSALVLRPWVGRSCDRRGRRPFLIGGAVVAAVVLALTAHVDSLAMLVGLRLVAGVAEAAVFVAAFAALADLAPPHRAGEALSYNSLALYLGLAGGPPLGELLAHRAGLAAAWYGASAIALLAALVLALIPETLAEPAPAGSTPPLLHRPSIPVVLGFLASTVAMGGFLAFVALHAEDIGLRHTSLPLVVYGSVVVVGRIAFARVPDRLPPLMLGGAALGMIAAGLLLAAAWLTPTGLLAGTGLMALGVTFSTPAFFTAVFAGTRPSERGAASGTTSAGIDLGLGLGPILLGLVVGGPGIPAAFAVAAGVGVAGAVWSFVLHARRSA